MISETTTNATPQWLDRQAYPFASQYLNVDGGRMHFVDEGQGQPIVFVHGTPTWSFLYRDLIVNLRDRYRCVAADQIGFGLSDKPAAWDYTPQAHARNLAQLIAQLGLRDIVLVVHDFGGPIGLSYAVEQPDNIAGLVLLNTWMWSLRGWNPSTESALRLLSSGFGRLLYKQFNLSARVLLPQLFAEKALLTPELHRHYTSPWASPAERQGTWVLARELLGSSDWYEGLWRRRGVLAGKPALLAWGMRDAAFDARALARWQEALPQATVVRFEQAGHFVPEEARDQLRSALSAFLAAQPVAQIR